MKRDNSNNDNEKNRTAVGLVCSVRTRRGKIVDRNRFSALILRLLNNRTIAREIGLKFRYILKQVQITNGVK